MVVIVHIFIPRFLDFIAGPFIGIGKTGCRPGSKNIKSFILNFEDTQMKIPAVYQVWRSKVRPDVERYMWRILAYTQ